MRCADGQTLQASLYAPDAPVAVLVVAPALGIPRRFYGRFAQYLMQERKVSVLSFDYRGSADSVLEVGTARTLQIRDWGERDLDAVLREALQRWSGRPLFLLGHSLGTQLAGMAEASRELRGLVMVAAPAPHWRHWHGWRRWTIRLFWKGVIPLAWQFRDDLYVPRVSHEELLRVYPGLAPERREVAPGDLGLRRIGHLGFFTPACLALWQQTAEWMLARAAPH